MESRLRCKGMVELQLSSALFRRNDFASFWSGSGTMSSILAPDPPHSIRYSKITVSNSGLCLTQRPPRLCSCFVHIICMRRGCDLIRAVLNGPWHKDLVMSVMTEE